MEVLSKGKPLAVNLFHTLENMLKSYVETDHLDILVNEIIANGYDAFMENDIKDGIISITLNRVEPYHCYIEFHNNAPPMSENQFIKKYHTLSESTKTLGKGIGYAGVGAKLFTASKHGGEIITITGKGPGDFMASKMYFDGHDVLHKTTNDFTLHEILEDPGYVHEYGTTYRAKLTLSAYRNLKERLPEIIQKWWNYCLLTKKFTVIINGKRLTHWEPKGAKKSKRTFTWKGSKIPAICYISPVAVPEENRHIVLTVYGKRIENNLLENPIQIKGDYASRVFCVADVSILSEHLRLNKESFEKNSQTGKCRNKIKESFWKFLEHEGLLRKEKVSSDTTVVVNELTKKLDVLLNKKEFRELNPFLNPRNRNVPAKGGDEDFAVSETNEDNVASGTDDASDGIGGDDAVDDVSTSEKETGTDVIQDKSGKEQGSMKNKKSKGLQIIPAFDITIHTEEAYVDLQRGGVVVDMTHPFFQLCANNPSLQDFNLNRILIEALIKFKNDEIEWDAVQTLNKFRDLFHACWK